MESDFKKKLNRIKEIAEDDFNLDNLDLEKKLRQIPNLHSSWMKRFYSQSYKLMKMESDLKKLYRDKLNYYLHNYEYEVKPNQVNFYIESDEEYARKLLRVDEQRILVDAIEGILKKVNQLSFDIKNLMDLKKLKMGVN